MKTLIICTNRRPFTTQPSCAQRGSETLAHWLESEIEQRNLDVCVERSVCLGHCVAGPNVRILGGDFFHHASKDSLAPLLDELDELDESFE